MKLTKGDILHYLLKQPVTWYLNRKFNIHIESNPLENIDQPYLLLGHHVTAFDPVISNMLSKRLIRYVAADANYDNLLKKILLHQFESIPFPKKRNNSKPIHRILNHIKKGHPIGLYPEGGRNWDGATDTIIPSTAKLIKLLKLPVYVIFYKGGYLSKPRWASHFRKGKMVLEVKKIMDEDAAEEKSAKEIYNLLVDELRYNEFDWQEKEKVIFKGKNLAEDIERLLYVCPNCLSVNSFKSKGNGFHCSTCRKEYLVNHYGKIEGCPQFCETVSWNKWQRSQIPDIIKKGLSFRNDSILLMKIDTKNNNVSRQLVSMTVMQDKLVIEYRNREIETISIDDISSISITFMDVFEFFVDQIKYRFMFDPKRHMSIKLFYDMLSHLKEKSKE